MTTTTARALSIDGARQRIADVDGEIHAWVHLDSHPVAISDGPLAGWSIGVKDLIDVAGMPTRAGSVAVNGGHSERARIDAPVVARLRAAGATILGKTAAVEYGWFGEVTTRNPHDLTRSPGGSSSGSAAAVAAGMCRAAIGTQTAGSVIRPAAYTGVPAVKFSHGVLDMTGIVPVSQALDVVGAFATTIADVATIARVLLGADNESQPRSDGPIRVGLLVHEFRDVCESGVIDEVLKAISPLAGDPRVELLPLTTGLGWDVLRGAHRGLMVRECALSRRAAFEQNWRQFSVVLQEAIREGLALDESVREAALQMRERAQRQVEGFAVDLLLTPAATQEAPPYGQPGDPSCQTPFSLLGLPAVHLPVGRGPQGLPVGVQLVGRHGNDLALLDDAAVIAAAFQQEAGR